MVVVEVSGRPVIGWDLPFPLYRDLRGGANGPDVEAVQRALHDTGHYSGPVDGVYGTGTALAVEALYRAASAEPPAPPQEAVDAARAADQAVAEARAAQSAEPGAQDDDQGTDSSRTLADARRAAAEAHTAALTPLPAAETFDLDGPQVTLVQVSAIGTVVEPGGPVAQVRSGAATVTARVGVGGAEAYTVGAAVTVSAPGGGPTTEGTVSAVGQFVAEATDDGAPPGFDITVELPEDAGLSDAASVIVSTTGAGDVAGLAVPLVAVREDASGTFVLRLPPDLAEPTERDAARVAVTVTTTGRLRPRHGDGPGTGRRRGRRDESVTSVLRAVDVHKTYLTDPPVPVLAGVDLELEPGERVAVVGRSGSGKSTFLNIVGLLDAPSSGRVELLGQDTGVLSARGRDRLRARTLGFVFQEHHVLGHRTVAENLQIAAAIAGTPTAQRGPLVGAALERVGLSGRQDSLGRLLSGGEKQRLGVARAVLSSPRLVLADEPTGNLDPENAENVLRLFDEQAAVGVAVLVITHDDRIAAWADRTVRRPGPSWRTWSGSRCARTRRRTSCRRRWST